MTEPVDTPKTRSVKLTGKLTVEVRYATSDQAAVVFKTARAAQRDVPKYGLQAIDALFRVVEKILVDPDDSQRIDDALMEGELTTRDLLKLFALEGEDADETAPRRVRRGRPSAK